MARIYWQLCWVDEKQEELKTRLIVKGEKKIVRHLWSCVHILTVGVHKTILIKKNLLLEIQI